MSSIQSALQISDTDLFGALSAGIVAMLDQLRIPAYIVDLQRRLRWQNAASIELLGDLRGRLDDRVGLDPQDLVRARQAFAQKLNGAAHTHLEVTLARPDGAPLRASVSSVPLKNADGAMIGSFGLVQVLGEAPPASAPSLSPRERETLTLLAAGLSTMQMAERMGISKETVRNHVKRVLKSLEASSRLEAVAKGRLAGLV